METCALFPIRGGQKLSLEMMIAESDPQQLTRSKKISVCLPPPSKILKCFRGLP